MGAQPPTRPVEPWSQSSSLPQGFPPREGSTRSKMGLPPPPVPISPPQGKGMSRARGPLSGVKRKEWQETAQKRVSHPTCVGKGGRAWLGVPWGRRGVPPDLRRASDSLGDNVMLVAGRGGAAWTVESWVGSRGLRPLCPSLVQEAEPGPAPPPPQRAPVSLTQAPPRLQNVRRSAQFPWSRSQIHHQLGREEQPSPPRPQKGQE